MYPRLSRPHKWCARAVANADPAAEPTPAVRTSVCSASTGTSCTRPHGCKLCGLAHDCRSICGGIHPDSSPPVGLTRPVDAMSHKLSAPCTLLDQDAVDDPIFPAGAGLVVVQHNLRAKNPASRHHQTTLWQPHPPARCWHAASKPVPSPRSHHKVAVATPTVKLNDVEYLKETSISLARDSELRAWSGALLQP